MAESIINLLEAVQITNHYRQGSVQALAPRQFTIKMDEQRAGIRQFRQIVRCR